MDKSEVKEMIWMLAGIGGLVCLGLAMAILLPFLVSVAQEVVGCDCAPKAFHFFLRHYQAQKRSRVASVSNPNRLNSRFQPLG